MLSESGIGFSPLALGLDHMDCLLGDLVLVLDEVGTDDGGGPGHSGMALHEHVLLVLDVLMDELVGAVEVQFDGVVGPVLDLYVLVLETSFRQVGILR